jgi:hypothetical protein
MAVDILHPHPGMRSWVNEFGATVLRLHYEADPDKGGGAKTEVEAAGHKLLLSPWALQQFRASTSHDLFLQEYEIVFDATQGALIYQYTPEATKEKSFPIPPDWTRIMALDPHPAVPHAFLWAAVDPWNDAWVYRELWPSKMYGKEGNVPEDDNRFRIKEYVETVAYLESEDNPENEYRGKRFREHIHKRVIDYAARAFGTGTSDDDAQPNFQQRYEGKAQELALAKDIEFSMQFEDAKKDHSVGEECVNEWLKPRTVDDGRDGWKEKSRLHIFADRCPELILQLRTVRRKRLTAMQAATQDPTGEQVKKRNHMTDDLRYICMAGPQYIPPVKARDTWKPQHTGIAY